MDKIEEVLTRCVENVLPDKSDLSKLMGRKKIRVYHGIDPTGPKLHLGHTIPLRKLQEFADLGHEAILVFGTGTVLAGDPSQRKEARKTITQEEIDENVKDWKRQAQKILDFDKIEIKYNGDWLLKLTIPELIKIESQLSAAQLFKREMFQERLASGGTVGYHETLYPVLQGYDSVHLDVDLEIGGTDQTFNMLVGRELQKKINNREKFVVATPLILGTDGKTMSKTAENCIWLDDSAPDMYGKILALPDWQIEQYWDNLTDLPLLKFKSLRAFDAKKELAKEIVKIYHGLAKSDQAEKDFNYVIQDKQIPISLPTYSPVSGATISQVLVGTELAESISEAKRLVQQGAVSGTASVQDITFEKISDPKFIPENDFILKKGNREYRKIEIKK